MNKQDIDEQINKGSTKLNNEKNIFEISYEWVQQEAEQLIKRKLTEEELYSVKKGIEWGLLTDIDTVFSTAILEAVNIQDI